MTGAPPIPKDFHKGAGVSRETCEGLKAYVSTIAKWSPRINLVSKNSLSEIWSRHIADSLQLLPLLPESSRKVADMGSGGGFPGLVLAIASKTANPERHFVFLESDQRKGIFLQKIIDDLRLNAHVEAKRIEQVDPLNADVVTARALADIDRLLDYSERHRSADGICLFLKGRNVDQELTLARQSWQVEYDLVPSKTDPDGVVVKIGKYHRVAKFPS